MESPLIYALNCIVTDAPWYVMACVPFWESKRIKKGTAVIGLLAILALRFTGAYLITSYAGNWQLWEICFILGLYTLILTGYVAASGAAPAKVVYIFLMIFVMATFSKFLTGLIIAPLLPPGRSPYDTVQFAAALSALLLLLLPFVYRAFRRLIPRAFSELPNRTIWMLCFTPVVFYVLNPFISLSVAGGSFAAVKVAVSLIGFAACYFNVFMMLDAANHIKTENALSVNNAALDRVSRMRSDVIATISHETRTPLAVLASYAGLVSMELKDQGMDEQITADLDTIAFEAKHVANLIDSMRKISQQEEVKAERAALDAGDLIRQTTRLYAPVVERGGVKLEVNAGSGAFPVFGNAEELTQVIFNLLQNARNHTGRGRITASVKSEGGNIVLTLSDTGTGVAPELLPRVFERGVTGGGGGTGIGLSICKEVVRSHGGRISIANNPDQGATVTVTLPEYVNAGKGGEKDAG